MAACRRISTCLTHFSRALTQLESQNGVKVGQQIYLNKRLTLLQNRHCSVAAKSEASQLETLLKSGSLDEVMGSVNFKTDVYLFGMPHNTSKDEIERFFEGLDMEDVCHVNTGRSKLKEIYYIRFKDEESKTKALAKDKEKIGDRYVEIKGAESKYKFGQLMLRERSKCISLANVPFDSNKEHIIQWFQPIEVRPEDVVFIRRGTCIVHLQNDSDVLEAFKKNHSDLGGRKVNMGGFITRDAQKEFEQKYL
ncbi:heterogeneous nuclear ribonucleoprotein H2-like [Mercenaria mercenaria]|uniref:heterogeneous nuclear ribonucleoprotein H2-like n=1 Tax=Mercenaria mercenaria TaxID=6596 RepID=UPI001E1E17AB|nr:heterogeneous nuclear ribonucleoprotein H2-like [Mercenaria mercenaria]